MNIKCKSTIKEFSRLPQGTVFKFVGVYYMKTEESKNSSINAVALRSGAFAHFLPRDPVEPKENSELIIK